MGVAVLPPQQDYFRNHHHHINHHRRNPNPNVMNRSNRRRRNSPPPPPPQQTPSGGPANKVQRARSPPTMMGVGQVRILKRGEDLSPSPSPSRTPPLVNKMSEPVPVLDGFYAGSAFATSPPPSELPLPAFFTGRRNCGLNHEIASELKRVLKLT